jgi:hypothetical protein
MATLSALVSGLDTDLGRAIGKVVSGWILSGHAGWPRMVRARVGLREIHRRLAAMLVRPVVRRAPIVRLRRPARTWGVDPLRSWDRSSS